MLSYERRNRMEQPPASSAREMKIRLPSHLANALHARKILTGEAIGKTVEVAVRAYLAASDAATGRPTNVAPFAFIGSLRHTEEASSE